MAGCTKRAGFAARYADRSASVGARVEASSSVDHLDLLADPTLHDDVVTIEPELHTFPVQDLIADVRLDQVVQLGGGGFAAPRRHVLGDEVVHHSLGDDDAAPVGIDGRHPLIGGEERDADQQEVQHRLAEKRSNAHTHPYFGEYQIGDVNARSCVVIGTFGSVILILKYAASYAVQRGVGISRTRA